MRSPAGCAGRTGPRPSGPTGWSATRPRSATASAASTTATPTSSTRPVEVEELRADPNAERGSFLWVGRLVPYKQPLLVAEAFRGLPQRLTMVGIGPLEEELRARLPENVELRGWISREELERLYGEAAGFLHVGEEDFGITMVEALAAGAPVIAQNAGGARDIVRDGVDGVLLDEPDLASLREAIERVAATDWDRQALAERAAEFSRPRFVAAMRALLTETMAR